MQAIRLSTVLLVSFLIPATADSVEAQTITYVPLYTFQGDNSLDRFGYSVSGAGDLNGDGKADLIVGAYLDDNNGNNSGSVRVLSGDDGSVLYTFDGDNADNFFGFSVSGAGDVNGDGTPDLIVGAYLNDTNGDNSGSVRVLSGNDGSVLYNFSGDSAGDNFGHSVSGAGDVNGDGKADLIVGVPGDSNNGIASGSARVLSGDDGSVLHTFDGDNAIDHFGYSVSGAGDVNGDGTPDLIVGAHRDGTNGSSSGSARVLSGSDGSVLYNFYGDSANDLFGRSLSGARDVNGDGFADLIIDSSANTRVLSGSDGSVLHDFAGESVGEFYRRSVSGVGDVNGDGMADLIIGAPRDNSGTGSARVLSGSDGSVLYSFEGDNNTQLFGRSVSGAGDVNGDGIDDFIIGAQSGGANGGGYARVFVSQISSTLGDCNLDGVVNFLDIQPFISILSAADYLTEADINEDGVVSFLDIQPFITLLAS